MSELHLILLSVIQGIAEFLPISSSAHLIILPHLLGEADQGVLLDIAAHIGTLAAVAVYFRKDCLSMIKGGFDILLNRKTDERNLALLILIATIPAVIGGGALFLIGEDIMRKLPIIVATNFTFAGLLWLADRFGKKEKSISDLTAKHALFIGMAQTVALIPGTSRSGITMTLSRFLGYTRTESARFSMLLSVPVILIAGMAGTADILTDAAENVAVSDILLVVGLSAASGIGAIYFLMHWLKNYSFLPFVLYRFALGFFILFHLI